MPGDLMALDDDIRILARVPLLKGFTTDQLRLLAFGAERVSLADREILFREGESADGAYVVASGRIALSQDDDGRIVPMGEARPPALLGELALIVDAARPCDALADGPAVLLKLDRKTFRRILEEYPDLAVRLHRRITRRFLDLTEGVARLAPKFRE